jgi:hypothetical protein
LEETLICFFSLVNRLVVAEFPCLKFSIEWNFKDSARFWKFDANTRNQVIQNPKIL